MPFIAASWFESFWKASACGYLTFEAYKPGMNRRIRRALDNSTVTVAFATSVPDEIVGYSVIEGTCLHYVYVKSAYRRQKVASALVPGKVLEYSHLGGKPSREFLKRLDLSYNPFVLEK